MNCYVLGFLAGCPTALPDIVNHSVWSRYIEHSYPIDCLLFQTMVTHNVKGKSKLSSAQQVTGILKVKTDN
jgi:hypothetical protein